MWHEMQFPVHYVPKKKRLEKKERKTKFVTIRQMSADAPSQLPYSKEETRETKHMQVY